MTWFQNQTKADTANKDPEARCGVRSFIRVSTAKDVAAVLYKDRVYKEIKTKTTAVPGSKLWLAMYPKALTKVFGKLSEEELEECDTTMEEWNKNGPGKAQQQK